MDDSGLARPNIRSFNEADPRKSEDALARLAAIVDFSDDAIVSKDLRGIITSWNAAASRIFGYQPEEIIGKSVLTLIPKPLQSEEPVILGKLTRGERIDHYETQRMRKDGSIIDVSLTISPLRDAKGRIIGASKIARDITEKKRDLVANARLAAIVDSSDDAIISKDLSGVISSWNAAATRIFGYQPEEIIGKSVLHLIPKELQSEEPVILGKLMRGERIDHYETKRMRKDGLIIDVSLTISPLRDPSGRVIGASKIARDITESKRSAEALRMADRLASVGRLAATIAHEINNPLEAVVNLVYLAKGASHNDPTATRDFLQLAEQELARVAHITKQTLAFSRGGKELSRTRVADHLQHLVSVFGPKIKNKGIKVTLDVRHDDLAVEAAGTELLQVFTNLLSNSVDAVPVEGEIKIRMGRTLMGGGVPAVRVSIADSGSGIPPEVKGRIFEAFFTTKRDVGTGLGLWVSHGIIRDLGGKIQTRTCTKPGRSGTVFSVVIPVSTRERLGSAESSESLQRDGVQFAS
ncbi:MAG TPA: PAS domain S-box protein [Terriglobales bacterium]|nr:PAS domain S-box protein [Terriglobales bacterium]